MTGLIQTLLIVKRVDQCNIIVLSIAKNIYCLQPSFMRHPVTRNLYFIFSLPKYLLYSTSDFFHPN